MELRCPRLKLVFSSVAFSASVPDSFAAAAEAEVSEEALEEAVLQPAKAVTVNAAAKRAARILFFIWITLSKCVDYFFHQSPAQQSGISEVLDVSLSACSLSLQQSGTSEDVASLSLQQSCVVLSL